MPRQKTFTLESNIERAACARIVKELRVHSVKFNTLGSDTGYPDRIFWLPGGKPVLIEFKRPGGKISPKQQYQIDRLKKLGYIVEVCYSEEEAYKKVKEAMGATQLSGEGS